MYIIIIYYITILLNYYFQEKVRNVIPNIKFFFSSMVIPKVILPKLSPLLSISYSTSNFTHMLF